MTHTITTTMSPDGMQVSADDPAALLVARLCHDLASPLGAIGNGVELLDMMSGFDGPELKLVGASVRLATARLRLFRVAFGPVQDGQMTGAAEVRALLQAHDETARFWCDYAIDRDLPRGHVKLLLLGLMCLETALAWGGSVRISATPDGYELCAVAERLRLDAGLWAALGCQAESGAAPAPVAPPTAATIHFPLLLRQAAEQGFAVTCSQSTTSLVLRLRDQIRNM